MLLIDMYNALFTFVDLTKTAVDWYNFIRDVCAEYFTRNPVVIGGPGVAVEINESKFGRRKYNRGHWQEGRWVFGGIQQGRNYVEAGEAVASSLFSALMNN